MEVAVKTIEEIKTSLAQISEAEEPEKYLISRIEEWMIAGAPAVPQKKTLEQRTTYFSNLQFLTLKQLLRNAADKTTGIV